MARIRKISADEILDATERVILRLGGAGLSIDAVAKEAGVSKSRVVYDHKSKSALLLALLERHCARDRQCLQQAVLDASESPHPELCARIALAERVPDELERAVFMAVSAAMPNEQDIQDKLRDWCREDMRAVLQTERPQAALLAYLALTGFFWSEFSGFQRWSEEERRRILDGIRRILAVLPEPPPASDLPTDALPESKTEG